MTNKEYQIRYRNKHRDKIKSRRKNWIFDNLESYNKKRKEYYKKNKERKKRLDKIYKDKNKEKILTREKERYRRNKEKILKNVQKYFIKNKERISEYKKKYRKLNRSKITNWQNEWTKKRKKTHPIFKLKMILRGRLYNYLKKKNLIKKCSFDKYIGCSPENLKKHLEKQFVDGMNWSNHGKWHIDHIKPLSSAKTEEEIYKLCHYSNLQPLWAKDNISKGNKIYEKSNKNMQVW